MRTRMDDRKNTTRSAASRGHGLVAGRSRGRGQSTVPSSLRAGRRIVVSSRGGWLAQSAGRGSPERRGSTGLARSPSGRGRGRPPGRSRGRPRGRGRAQLAAVQSEEDEDDPSGEEEEEEEDTEPVVREEQEDTGEEEEDVHQQQPRAVSPRRRLAAGSSAESSTEADESGDDMLIDVLAASDFGRSSRKRQLPARFRDAPLQPLVRRRTVSSGSARADKTAVSPEKERQQPVDRSPVKQERSPVRSPPTIAEKLERQAAEEARAAAAAATAAAAAAAERSVSPKEEPPLVIESLESLTDVIELDHGMGSAPPPPPASPPRKRQRLQSRSSDAGGPAVGDHETLASAHLFPTDELVERRGQASEVLDAEEIDEHDLISMELEPMEVPLPVETVPRRPCKICHRHFKVTNLKQHMLTHTGMRPFKCEICHAAFTRRSDVFRHVKILHQQEKPFKCAKDGKEFSDRKTLKAHMELRHKRPALFACKVCDFRFGKFEYYVNHLKFIHPTGEPLPAFPEDVEPEPEPVAPPRGRYGPTPLQAYLEDDDDSHGTGGLEHGMADELQLGGGLESIETEEIPHDSMHLVSPGAAEQAAVAAATAAAGGDGDGDGDDGPPPAALLPDPAVPDVVEGQDVVISAAGPAPEQPRPEQRPSGGEKDDPPPPEQINFPPLEEDAAAILGMTDLALTNENTSLQSVAAPIEEQPPQLETTMASAPVVVLSGTPLRRYADPLISTRTLTQSQPRVVTIGKPVTPAGSGGPKTVLLTRPKMVGGKQVLQAVKLGAGQKIVSARAPSGPGGGGGGSGRQPIVRQVLINRPSDGGVVRAAPRAATSRVVRPATRIVPIAGTRTLASAAAASSHFMKTVSPAIRVVRPAAPHPPPPPPPPPPSDPPRQEPVAVMTAEQTGPDTKNIEVTTSTAGGSRTIILQTSGGGGGGGDILQSEEAMQTLLEAVQQLVSASGDTLEGKQIEIVMQNDGQQGGGPAVTAAAAETGAETEATDVVAVSQ